MLRVGAADEPLPLRGVGHMLEHLSLHGIGRPGEHTHGAVDTTTMHLHTSGEPAEVAAFLGQVTRRLVDPPVDRLEDEKGVLRAEAARRAPWAFGELAVWRWGVRGHGAEGTREWGVPLLDADALRAWSARFVSRQNAVLWFSGPPPAGLEFHLPEGTHVPAPPARHTLLPALPAYFRTQAELVALSAVVPRSTAANAAAAILNDRLVDDLRTARAAAYSPEVGYRPVDAETGLVLVLSDVVAGRTAEVLPTVVETLTRLAQDGPRPEELAAHRERVRRAWSAGPVETWLGSTVWNLVQGAEPRTPEQLLAELDALTPDTLREAAQQALATALVQVPPGTPVPPGWSAAPVSLARPVPGTGHEHRTLDARLVVTDEGVTLHEKELELTVRYADLAGVVVWPDGGRVLIGNDSVHLTVEPTLWRSGPAMVRAIDAATPAQARIPLAPRAPDAVPSPGPWHKQRLAPAVRVAFQVVGLAIVGVLVFVAANGALGSIGPAGGGAGALALGLLLAAARRGSQTGH